jgi:hypothetical protein
MDTRADAMLLSQKAQQAASLIALCKECYTQSQHADGTKVVHDVQARCTKGPKPP